MYKFAEDFARGWGPLAVFYRGGANFEVTPLIRELSN